MNIKPLEWKKLDMWIAETPAARSGYIMVAFEQDKYWPIWDCNLPGYDTLEEAQEQGQLFHNRYVENFVSQYIG